MGAVAPERRLARRYVLQEVIAGGGMATLWRAVDEILARPVAIKVLRDDLAGDPEFYERFQAEAVAAARLTHPSIISVFDTGTDDGVAYIVMEFFRGNTLRQVMAERRSMAPTEAVDVLLPVLSALATQVAKVIAEETSPPRGRSSAPFATSRRSRSGGTRSMLGPTSIRWVSSCTSS